MSSMRALVLQDVEKLEERSVLRPEPQEHEVLVRVGAVGLCGTDFHIYEGHANYHCDAAGRPIPLAQAPQILGHEFCGTVVDAGNAVVDLKAGDRVVVDQGLNCKSRREVELCEYCATGHSHQCAQYAEHGITGLPGALAEYIAVSAVNAVKIGDVPFERAALVEPLGCVIHASEAAAEATARYRFDCPRTIRSVLICGAGPAGLLFTQYLRQILAYDGLLMVSEPNAKRRALAAEFGATVIDPRAVDLVAAVLELTRGERVQYLVESAGVADLFTQMPGLLRKQATVVLYGHGHRGVDLGVLNNVQFLEPTLVAAVGASGGFRVDGRPRTYARALEWIEGGKIDVARFITHRYDSLSKVPRAFERDRFEPDYIKGVVVLPASSPDGLK
jgi:threonine dehydrogenase-like Zn-dependent dehydrogenase